MTSDRRSRSLFGRVFLAEPGSHFGGKCFGVASRRVAACAGAVATVAGATMPLVDAVAADLGGARRSQSYYEPIAPRTEIERWTGFYLGATAGGAFGSPDVRGDFGTSSIDVRGASGGILAGYNWQAGRVVFGVESDFSLANLDGARTNDVGTTFKADIDKIGTLRARLGLLATPSMMVYATGGLAWAGVDLTSVGSPIRSSEVMRGWQLGTGVEWKFAPNWTFRTEYLYTDLGDRTLGVGGQTNQFDVNFHQVRAGLTFKF